MSAPDVAGILAALARLPGTSPERRAALHVGRSAHVAARALHAGVYRGQGIARRVDDRLVRDIRRRNARTQPRERNGRFACRT